MRKQDIHDLTFEWMKVQYEVSCYISAFIPNFHDAQDVIQQVAMVVIQKSYQFDPDTSFRRWVLAIARFEVLNYRKLKAREKLVFDQELIDEITDFCHETYSEDSVIRDALHHCLCHVKGRNREALQLWYGKQMKGEQIASSLGMKKNALYVMLNRIRTSLRNCVQRRLAWEGHL